MDQTDISMKYLRNQKLPALDVIGAYNVQGVAGTQFEFDRTQAFPSAVIGQTQRSFTDSLRDVFANDFKTWSIAFNRELSARHERRGCRARAGAAAARPTDDNQRDLETIVVAQVRDAGRQVSTALKRVETTQKARQLAEQNARRPKRSGWQSGCPTRSVCSRLSAT